MSYAQNDLPGSSIPAEPLWPARRRWVHAWPASIPGWTRAILIAVVGLAFAAFIQKVRPELEIAYGVHDVRSNSPECETIRLRHDDGDTYLVDCNDPPSYTLATSQLSANVRD